MRAERGRCRSSSEDEQDEEKEGSSRREGCRGRRKVRSGADAVTMGGGRARRDEVEVDDDMEGGRRRKMSWWGGESAAAAGRGGRAGGERRRARCASACATVAKYRDDEGCGVGTDRSSSSSSSTKRWLRAYGDSGVRAECGRRADAAEAGREGDDEPEANDGEVREGGRAVAAEEEEAEVERYIEVSSALARGSRVRVCVCAIDSRSRRAGVRGEGNEKSGSQARRVAQTTAPSPGLDLEPTEREVWNHESGTLWPSLGRMP